MLDTIQVISFDLDDTLWPTAPTILSAEKAAMDWMRKHAPGAAEHAQENPFRSVKERLALAHPEHAHNISAIRMKAFEENMREGGDAAHLAETAYQQYYQARQRVSLFADALPVLKTLSQHYTLVSVTNGNADPEQTPLRNLFDMHVNPEVAGASKPNPDIYWYMLKRLSLPAETVLHVGDDIVNDIEGAKKAGVNTVLIDRNQQCQRLANVADFYILELCELINLLKIKDKD